MSARYSIHNAPITIKLTGCKIPPRLGREALTALAKWMEIRNEQDIAKKHSRLVNNSYRKTKAGDLKIRKNGLKPIETAKKGGSN